MTTRRLRFSGASRPHHVQRDRAFRVVQQLQLFVRLVAALSISKYPLRSLISLGRGLHKTHHCWLVSEIPTVSQLSQELVDNRNNLVENLARDGQRTTRLVAHTCHDIFNTTLGALQMQLHLISTLMKYPPTGPSSARRHRVFVNTVQFQFHAFLMHRLMRRTPVDLSIQSTGPALRESKP